jgi:hypothetical protein
LLKGHVVYLVKVSCPFRKNPNQVGQMVYFQTKNPAKDQFGRVLQWKMLVILRPLGIFLPGLGIYQEKSCNPVFKSASSVSNVIFL